MSTSGRKPVIVVQGGQWGSEAKGAVAGRLCVTRDIDFTVRTGAINAGHTVVYNGIRYAMQQIPVGWVNPKTKLVIGAGAYIHLPTLIREINLINKAMPESEVLSRLVIDYRCGIHNEEHEGRSKEANRHHKIGATGKGCSEAIVGKIRDRNNGYSLFKQVWDDMRSKKDFGVTLDLTFADTAMLLNMAVDHGASILIEGTQGTLLDLHLGPYPFTTSRMTSAANWVAECGLSPSLGYEVVLVCRTFPIRVAGNSGPMSNEIEWTDLANNINLRLVNDGLPSLVSTSALIQYDNNLQNAAAIATKEGKYRVPTLGRMFCTRMSEWTPEERSTYRVAASELNRDALMLCDAQTQRELGKLFEMTTVTKKLRRIAALTMEDLRVAVAINRPSWIAMTFLDYVEPALMNTTASMMTNDDLRMPVLRAKDYIDAIADKLEVPIKMVSVGPGHEHMFNAKHLDLRQSTR